MDEYVEIASQKSRICRTYKECSECPLNGEGTCDLEAIPAIGRDESYIIDGFAYSESYALTNTRISADIAEKLGLKPEET